jgi:polyisoprenyl-phosphate glycosyltransferase
MARYTMRGGSSRMAAVSIIGRTQLMAMGIVGEDVGKIHEPAKERPLYLVARTMNVSSAKPEPANEWLSRSED